VDAVRKRIQRGTLESEKADGKVYVWLDDGAPRSDTDALISEMRAHNDTLREQLQAARNAHAEARRLLAAALERIPALESSHDPETPSEPVPRTARHPRNRRRPLSAYRGGGGCLEVNDIPGLPAICAISGGLH
jgi:hypothetical protein